MSFEDRTDDRRDITPVMFPVKAYRRLFPRGLGLWLICVFFPLFVLSGCNTASIYQDDAYNPPVYWGQHVVRSGETLYSIAWRYGRDYRELGDANGMSPPYRLQVGRVLRLDLRGNVPSGSATKSRPTVASKPAARPKATPKPKVQKRPKSSEPLAKQSQVVSNIQWHWPNVGPVIAGYSTSGKVNKGVDIAGKAGDPVKAAASGSVVYAGSGLLGYGNLIIVNHNEHFLSAYAHNRKILVQEGENVRAGQLIAEMGSSGSRSVRLHFEIRKNGNPVDPMHYLPPR